MNIEEIRKRHEDAEKYDHDSPREEQMHQDRGALLDENAVLKGRIEHLEAGYAECIEEVEHWGAYASGYFQQKHDLEGEVERHKSILKGEG